MNERIEDLMYRAGLTAQGCWDEMDDYNKQAIEKFAELIVQDCAAEADKQTIYCRGIPWGRWIKEHFGVK
jgi:hypothetical protein